MALLAGSMTALMAETQVFVYDYLGEVDGVSDNGHYAAITDTDNGFAYLWNSEKPEDLEDISYISDPDTPSSMAATGTFVYDVSDNGIVVGAIRFGDNGQRNPAYYVDGEWHLLPMDPNAMNSNEAVAITPDGKIIAGYHFIFDPSTQTDVKGRYYPCQWYLQEDNSYELKSYNTLKLPDHQGFFPHTQSPDGRVVAGTVYCGIGSNIPAIMKDGEFVIFDEVETRWEPWMFRGKWFAGQETLPDGTVKQYWVDDVNDPNVVLFPEEYINGYRDAENRLEGMFVGCDDKGNIYGARSLVENVTEDGDGDVYTRACVYNYLDDTWYYEEGVDMLVAGVGKDKMFTISGDVIDGNDITNARDAYDIVTDYSISGIYRCSVDAKTLGGIAYEVHPGTGQPMFYPFMIMIDGGTYATTGVQCVAGNPKEALIIVATGHIEVVNASQVAVYDMNGKLMGNTAVTPVEAGIYVVVADGKSYKICVK